MQTIDIKGKPYVTVDSRVEAFRELYPNGAIVTELLSDDGERCVFKASAFSVFDERDPISTGHAFELRDASYINKTSYLENCETSAVGRALGFLGIGLNGSIASADEVANAVQQQKQPAKGRFAKISALKDEAVSMGIKEEAIKEWMAANIGEDMRTFTNEQISGVELHIAQLIEDKKSL